MDIKLQASCIIMSVLFRANCKSFLPVALLNSFTLDYLAENGDQYDLSVFVYEDDKVKAASNEYLDDQLLF